MAPQAGVTYTWTASGGSIQGPGTGSTITFAANQAGLLTLTCVAVLGSESSQSTTQVQVQGAPPAVPQILAPSAAGPGTANLTATVAQPEGDTSYTWGIVDGTITAGSNGTTVTFTAGSAGTLMLTCAATNTVGSSSAQAVVRVVSSAPATPVITAPSQVLAQSMQNVASVPAQAGCTYAWTLAGGAITAGQGTASVTFTAGSAGTAMVLGCTVTNSASVSASAQQSITVVSASQGGYYGSQVNADDLANQLVGWNTAVDTCNKAASCRIRAQHTGRLVCTRT
jgi:hypothetical protein